MSLVPVHDGRFMAAYILLTERQLTLKEVVALLLTRPCRSGRAGSDEGGVATSLVSNRRNSVLGTSTRFLEAIQDLELGEFLGNVAL